MIRIWDGLVVTGGGLVPWAVETKRVKGRVVGRNEPKPTEETGREKDLMNGANLGDWRLPFCFPLSF